MISTSDRDRCRLISWHVVTEYARDRVARALYEATIEGLEFGPRDLPSTEDREWSAARSRSRFWKQAMRQSRSWPGPWPGLSSGLQTAYSDVTSRATTSRSLGSSEGIPQAPPVPRAAPSSCGPGKGGLDRLVESRTRGLPQERGNGMRP